MEGKDPLAVTTLHDETKISPIMTEKSWLKFHLEQEITENLVKHGFVNPTEIQHRMLFYHDYPVDIVGVSQTGSGKTLAYLIPMMNNLIKQIKSQEEQDELDQEEEEEENDDQEGDDQEEDDNQEEDDDQESQENELEKIDDLDLNMDEQDQEDQSQEELDENDEDTDKEEIQEENQEENLIENQEENQEEDEIEVPRQSRKSKGGLKDYMQGLVLVPTRELAIQVYKVAKMLKEGKYQKQIRVGLVIGGLSKLKQRRIVEQKPHVLICTAGRLWDLIDQENLLYLRSLAMIKFLILDEADRMIELGQFKELDKLLKFIYSNAITEQETQHSIQRDIQKRIQQNQEFSGGIPEDLIGKVESGVTFQSVANCSECFTQQEINMMKSAQGRRRTIVISATLGKSFWTSRMMNKLNRKKLRKAIKKDKDTDFNPKIDEISRKLKFNFKMKIIDLTKEQNEVMPSQLQIMRVKCVTEDKLLFLVHFCQVYADQSIIIFTNSINSTKRVSSILQTMDINSIALHSKQQQRQRITKLEQFRDFKKRVLVATDVASRGLDIPKVGVVIHLHLPKDADSFMHRCGRTARIGQQGLSLIISDSDDGSRFMKYLKDVGGKEKVKMIQVPLQKLDQIREHVDRANKLEKEKFQIEKNIKEKKWFRRQAENGGLEYSDEEFDHFNKEKIREGFVSEKLVFKQKLEYEENRVQQELVSKQVKIKEKMHKKELRNMVNQRNSVNAKKKGKSIIMNPQDMLAARAQLERIRKQREMKELQQLVDSEEQKLKSKKSGSQGPAKDKEDNKAEGFAVNYLSKRGKGSSKGDKVGNTGQNARNIKKQQQKKRAGSKHIRKRRK